MTDPFTSNLTTAETALRDARAGLSAEISQYPTPISGCDAQFNHLLALRRKVDAALDALDRDVLIPTPRSPH